MIELSFLECQQVNGGSFKIHINLGAFLAAIATGAVTGGPAGIGVALCAMVISEGVNNLNALHSHENKPFSYLPEHLW